MWSRIAASVVIVTLNIGVAHAAPGGGKKDGADINYNIDPDGCEVTITSTKRISSIVLKDGDGNTVEEWDRIRGKSFNNFGMFTMQLPDGELFVTSGKRGSVSEIGDQFRLELESCLLPDCPFADVIMNFNMPSTALYDGVDSCLIQEAGGTKFIFLGDDRQFDNSIPIEPEYQGELFFGASTLGGCLSIAPTPLPDNSTLPACSTGLVDGRLDSDQARACADLTQLCEAFDIPD